MRRAGLFTALAFSALTAAEVGAQTYTFSNVAGLYSSNGVAIDPAGNLFATASYVHTVQRISPTGIITTLAGLPSIAGAVDGPAGAARFNSPRGVAIDSAGNIYVADSGNHTIRKVTPAGDVMTVAGLAGTRGWDDGPSSAARFDAPQGVAVDASGIVYVADTGSRSIRKITPAGIVTTLAGLGYVSGYVDGTGLAARFDTPQGIAVAANGDVYVADTNNHAIRKITPAGVTTTIAGSLTNRGSSDGVGAAARFDSPQGIALDASGVLFVADTNNYLIRKITTTGAVSTIAGLVGFSGSSPGVGAEARFNQLRGIAVGNNGSVAVADSYNVKLGAPSSQLAITVQPQPLNVAAGSAARLNVTATGAAPVTFQWQKDGVPVPGATASNLTLAVVQAASSGGYSVVVTNPVTTVTSNTAVLTVLSPLPNDNISGAQSLTGLSGQFSGHNNGATAEPGEPTHVTPHATASSIWYRWTAPESGTAVFDFTTNFPVVAGVYVGSALDTLTRIAVAAGARLRFPATAGSTYYLVIGSSIQSSRGNVTLTWRIIPNDTFARAQPIAGSAGSVSGDNGGATGEPDEPVHLAGTGSATNSVWYAWTPTQTGVARFTTGPDSGLVTAAYTGNSLASLTRVGVGSSPDETVFVANAGTTYRIVVGSHSYRIGSFTLSWSTSLAPVITSTQPGNISVAMGGSTSFSVTALSAQPVTFRWFHALTPRTSTVVREASSSTLSLENIQPGDAGMYSVQVTNDAGTTSRIVGTLTVLVPPANDNFAEAQALAGLNGTVSGTNLNATGEPDEPAHWNAGGTASSVWYHWTPLSSGLAVIDTVGSKIDTVLAVYTGTTLGSLTRVTQDDDRGGGRTSQVSFAASAGTTYRIAIGSSHNGLRGDLQLGWQLSPVLAIATSPASQTIAAGGSATFSVQATGSGVTYQWSRNGVIIPGATNATLTVANVQGGADASFTVTVSNPAGGSVTSAPATLTVAAPSVTTLALRHTRADANLLWSIAGNGNTLVTVGSGGVILTSTDAGGTWAPRVSGTLGWLVAVTYGGGQFVIVGESGTILTSPDGAVWSRVASAGTTERLNNVIYADGKYVAVGEHGAVVTSTDARVWTPRATGVNTWLHGLAYHEGIRHFVTCGEAAVLLYSPDAVTWTRLPVPGYSAALQHAVAVDSYATFVAVGEFGMAVSVRRNELILKDGESLVTWTAEANPTSTTAHLIGLVQGASALFAMGEDGKVITAASDRGPWYTVPSGTTGLLLAGLYHQNSLYIVGERETVIQSDPLYASRMINISTRGQVGTDSNLMISGFVITGDRPKQVLVRAAGPTLAASFRLSGILEAPVLTLVDAQNRTIATNTGWTLGPNTAAITATAARVGAFPFTANSADSALLATLAPGAYTALISGANATSGLSIVEVYDADTLGNEGSRTINISTRGVAGADANKMIAGFVINGASSRRVLIRAVGPTIGAPLFNVGGTLAEPQIQLYNNRNLLHATAGAWGLQSNADEIRGAARAVGAFTLPDGSKDSAMVVTLLPGAWAVQVGGVGNASGVVLVEIYALP